MKGLNITGLSVKLGEFVLGPVELAMPGDGYLVLLGPSGCGKTTLLKCIAGLVLPSAGVISLDGSAVGGEPPWLRRIGYVPQSATLFPHLGVRGNIEFGLPSEFTECERNARVEEVSSLMGVSHLLARPVRGLSGGEAKRVALARALAAGPRLLLLDEPLGMLDANSREDMAEVLGELRNREGLLAIHVTHDREEAWNMKALCGVMMDGRIAQVAGVSGLFSRPVSEQVARFLGYRNILSGSIGSDGVLSCGWAAWPGYGPSTGECRFLLPAEAIRPARPGEEPAFRAKVMEMTLRASSAELVVSPAGSGVRLIVRMPTEVLPSVGDEPGFVAAGPVILKG
jgi:molybdate/tungstate transport system ATP-binding protein